MSDLRKDRLAHAHVLVTCGVCLSSEPLLTADDHHVVGRAQGGTDDEENRIWLCASCHKRLHRVAGLLSKGKTGEAYALINQIFPRSSDNRGRLWEFSQIAAKAEVEAKESFHSHRTHVKAMVPVDVETWDFLKAEAKRGKTSAKDLAAAILKEWVRSQR